jgi:UPF0176 protein
MQKEGFQVLLYYKFVPINDPEEIMVWQRELCQRLNIKGRIIIAKEGLNGTIEGTFQSTEEYISEVKKNKYFKDMNFKKSSGKGNAFPKLSIKVRNEVVASGKAGIDPNLVRGKYISAQELHSWFEEKKEFYIVDMRNDYEYASGYFENSLFSGLHNFFDLPNVLPKIRHLKGKAVVTVCTGGIRCEKASGFLVVSGFENVYQLKDGIQTYMEKYPNEHFKGKLYVFDNRLTIGFNTDDPQHEVVGKCMHCGVPADSYVNCAYDICHLHYICCSNCLDKQTGLAFSKQECKEKYLIQKYPANSGYPT